MDLNAFARVLKRYAVALKIDPHVVRLHGLRHTFATLAIRNGAPPPDLQAFLGHSDYRTTQIYVEANRSGGPAIVRMVQFGVGGSG